MRLPGLLFFVMYFFLSGGLSANEHTVHYSLHKEVITVNSIETGYTSSVYCRGKFTSLIGRETDIPYSELEALGGIRARYKNEHGKYKDLAEENIHNTAIMGGSSSNGGNKYVLSWPSKGNDELSFLYTYKSNCKELMTLAGRITNDFDRTDTFEYEIRIPPGIFFYFQLPVGVAGVKVDSSSSAAGTVYHFISCPTSPILLASHLEEYQEYSFPPRAIRMILVPAAYEHRPWAWLNDWFKILIHDNPGLNKECIKSIEFAKGNVADPDSIASHLFDYVKNNITYIDVEAGLGAFKPRDVNLVLTNHQGDCKDMASLLCDALTASGIEAYRAISSSISHESDMDFPSLSSGNHMICVARIGGKLRYLDATDPVCVYGYPSMHIQGRQIYVLTNQGGLLEKVPIVEPGLNESRCNIKLRVAALAMEGTISYHLHGLSMHEERIAKFAQSEEEVSKASLKAIQELTHNTSITDLHIRDYDSALIISGNMKVMNEMATIEGKNSLQLNYLPFPHKYPRYWNEGTKIINYQTLDNRFDCSISFDNPIKLHAVENIHFSKDGFIFDFFVQQASDRSIRIRYSFSYNDVEITDLKQKSYSEVNRLIEHTLNGILLYE